ncbi:MAG: hypothetical protein IPP37_06540 [Saprospiraceae bacterium]|nr:hypothetical protein [Saprospiraceae bacterium]
MVSISMALTRSLPILYPSADPSVKILHRNHLNAGDVYFIRGLNDEGCDDMVVIYFNVLDA